MSTTFCPMENGDNLVMGAGPRREPQRDRAPLQARRRRLRPVQPRRHDGLPGRQAAVRQGPARTCSATTPEELVALAGARLAHAHASTSACCTTRCGCSPAAPPTSSTTTSSPTILKGCSSSSGIIGTKVGPCRRGRASCCCSTAWASTTASSARGRSTRVATAASPRCWRAPPSRSAPRSCSRRRSSGSSPATAARPAWR